MEILNQPDIPPQSHLSLVVVIPCYGEPELEHTLQSLCQCELPLDVQVEVLVVLNEAQNSPLEKKELNQHTWRQWPTWQKRYQKTNLACSAVYLTEIADKVAGVGFARRYGMDWAYKRFKTPGVIACLDADCTCASNYLIEIVKHFQTYPKTPGCSIYFEHPLSGPLESVLYRGITWYELYLRYYRYGLVLAESPYAFHCVGSCMAVRSEVYHKVGGMNQRQAAEDFYFIQKLVQQGHYSYLTRTTVYPSPRLSERVPFGTGVAQSKWVADPHFYLEQNYWVNTPQVYWDLRQLHQMLPRLFATSVSEIGVKCLAELAPPMQAYLHHLDVLTHLAEMRGNSRHLAGFNKRFFQWFNHLKTFQYLHHVHESGDPRYAQIPLLDALASLSHGLQWPNVPGLATSAAMWLNYLRCLETARS